MTDAGLDRRYYELCALSELKNALRSGDIWVQGSRQFKDFEDYLVPPDTFASLKQSRELPLEVDEWTGLSQHFTRLKSGDLAKDKNLLLTTLLADAIPLGLTKMAESCPGTTYAKLAWLQAWHIRYETYGAALADLANAQFRHPFAGHWDDGTTSSSDGQNFRTGRKATST